MLASNVMVALIDCNTIQDNDGSRKIVLSNIKKVIASVDLVGVATLTLAQAQAITLNYSITIDRMFYNKERYCYWIDSKELCEIKSLGKAKDPKDMLLNVSIIKDEDIENILSFLHVR